MSYTSENTRTEPFTRPNIMSSVTTTPTPSPDLCTQWTQLPNDEITTDSIGRLLEPVQDDYWVSVACVDRVVDDADVQRALIDLGVLRTLNAVERCKRIYEEPSAVGSEEEEDEDATSNDAQAEPTEGQRHAALVAHFRHEPADAQLCRIRDVLLERLDRLNTYVDICKELPPAKNAEDELDEDEEWADDPWGEDAAPRSTSTSASARELPISLADFLLGDLFDVACMFASLEHFAALRVLLERHGSYLWAYRLHILAHIPEHASPQTYRDVLPTYEPNTSQEQILENKPWRAEVDFAQLPSARTALAESDVPSLVASPPSNPPGLPPHPEALTPPELTAWYRQRADRIISSTGMVDAALSLVQHGASQGVPGLDALGEDLSLLVRLVYDAPASAEHADDEWTLERWAAMDAPAVVRAYLKHSSPATIARDISRLVMPYLFVAESRAERAGHPDPALATDALYGYILRAPLALVRAVFDASKPTLPPAERVIRGDADMVRLALACLYGSDSLDEWATMSAIFECLPAWETRAEQEDEADAAETTIASLGALVTPTTGRPRCTPADLLVFFQPLPSTSLSHALDILDVHLESGEILARWGVPAPLRWFLQSNADFQEQRAWANRLARRADAAEERLETQEDWEWLLEDMLKLVGSDEGDSRGAFCLLSRDDIVRIFFSGLLSTGSGYLFYRLGM